MKKYLRCRQRQIATPYFPLKVTIKSPRRKNRGLKAFILNVGITCWRLQPEMYKAVGVKILSIIYYR